ncbi:hypothetical protein KC19_5G014000 [Ceratodon purpureus]|uniref:C-terminal of Roc (COR) domain-containing protein n=1 Tax=Ceratodon purpureus TaxID=3225 RepID=A0A8T0HXR3_CERPU|nr:hypothetical protein KC19_5G014000 [Ceratodon purpureus]
MRGVMAFKVWLFSFWTWFKAFFSVRWSQTPPLDQASLDTSLGVEQLRSDEGHHESELTAFLASLAEDKVRRLIYYPDHDGIRLSIYGADRSEGEFSGGEATHREFLAAVASSKVACCESISIGEYGASCNLKQLEEMVRALVPNSNFTEVRLDTSEVSPLQMAECVSNLLSGNKAIEQLYLSSDSHEVVRKEAAELLAKGLRENRVLKRLDLWYIYGLVDDEAMEVLTKPLKENDSVLQDLGVGKITDVGLEHLGVMLGTNTSLKRLEYWDYDKADDPTRSDEVYVRGYTSLSEALCANRSLESLDCTVSSSMELKVLLQPLMPTNNKPQANTTLTELWLPDSTIGGKEGVGILVDMIRTNTSLLRLSLLRMTELCDSDPDAVENVVAILEALKTNKSLKYVRFGACSGVGGYKVLGTMMDLLLENRQLEEIDLFGTRLEDSGDARYVHSELEKRRKFKLWDLIKGMANVSPKSGRVFLCGNPYAGKTTLRKSMKLLDVFDNKQSSLLLLKKRAKKIISDKLWTKTEAKVSKPKLVLERTRGIEVDHVECNGIGISIWDMAGQTDYHSFHDLVVPNLSADGSCSLFLLTCNPLQRHSFQKRNISDIKEEVKYWLRFIASNTRRSSAYRPHVSIVMTHFDHWNTQAAFASRIEDVVVELKLEFQEVLDFDPKREIFKVYGEDITHARGVFDFIKVHMKKLLDRLPKTIKACSEVQHLLAEWNKDILKDPEASKLPILKWDEFSEKICKQVEDLQDANKVLAQRKQEFVAISLNDGGHIMYHEEGKFVISNPHWFCHDIMGEFLNRCANVDSKLEMVSSHGMISIEHVKRILSDFIGGQGHEEFLEAIVDMMIKLHMCYKQDDKKIMIPSTLRDRSERLNWPTPQKAAKLNYVGRRFSCKDVKRTMLSPGFFPRLQASFFKKFQHTNVGNSYQIYEDVIMFICDGIEVIVEYDHVDVDIFLRSKESQDRMLEYLENDIVRHIQDLLMDSTLGCPGVILIEHILRPECVQELIDVKYRKDQFVSFEELKLEVVKSGFDATHIWKPSKVLQTGYDMVKDLLGSKAWEKLLKKRQEELKSYQRQILHASIQTDSFIEKDNMNCTWRSVIWHIPQRFVDLIQGHHNSRSKEESAKLENIERKLDVVIREVDVVNKKVDVVIKKVDDILQMEEDILEMQYNLLHEVSTRLEDLMELSIKMQQSQVPKLAYLFEIGKKKLLTSFVPGLMEFQLHLMCESKDGVHEVVNQLGCRIRFGTDMTRTFVTILVWGLKMATILTKIGAHVAGGMGGMVPDFGEGLQLAGLILDTPGLLDQMSALCLESLPEDVKLSPNITNDDRTKAEDWLIEVLEPKCKEKSTFYQMFGLKKVVYKAGSSGKHTTAWLCDHCEKNGIQSGILYRT